MNSLVSIIVPVYNVEKYIEKCIKSIVNQTYKNLEIILIDDGSIDNSGNLCDRFAQKDERIVVIHQKNHGQAYARNIGLENARGKWLYFLDSDDWIHETIIEKLVGIAQLSNSDITICNSIDVGEDGNILVNQEGSGKIEILNSQTIIDRLISSTDNIRFELWNKLWKRELIADTRFLVGQLSEEVHFDRILFLRADNIVYIDEYLHYYRVQRPGNTNSSFKIARLGVFYEFCEWIKELERAGNTNSVHVIGYIACNTAAGLYYMAKITNQKREIIDYLKQQFEIFYPYVIYTPHNTFKIRLFNFSPIIYCFISKIYKCYMKER